jgi:hypothetical protein
MKHYILVSLTVPIRTHPLYAEWLMLSEKLRETALTTKEVVTLGESSWLIPRDAGISFLAECIHAATKYEFPRRIWFLDEDA